MYVDLHAEERYRCCLKKGKEKNKKENCEGTPRLRVSQILHEHLYKSSCILFHLYAIYDLAY